MTIQELYEWACSKGVANCDLNESITRKTCDELTSIELIKENTKAETVTEFADSINEVLDKIRAEIDELNVLRFLSGERIYKDEVLEIIDKYKESNEAQPKQTNDSCLDFDFDKAKEFLKKDGLDNFIVDHTCKQTRYTNLIDAIDFAINATDSQDDYSMGMRNGMRYVKSLVDSKEPQYESRRTDEERKIGDEVVNDYGAKGVVVGIDTYEGEAWLSLLMRNHKVPQLVKASGYKKTGRHFRQVTKVLEQIKGEAESEGGNDD